MATSEEYAAFMKKVERTLYVDNISPNVTEAVLKAAFNQFVNVVKVEFIHAYLQPNGVHAVLVEMESREQVEAVIAEMDNHPFMVGGMPRPVRGKPARLEMFSDRPRKPGRKIWFKWLTVRDPDYQVARNIKKVVKRHAEEAAFMLKKQLEEEEKLAKLQSGTLVLNHKKLELIEGEGGALNQLRDRYRE